MAQKTESQVLSYKMIDFLKYKDDNYMAPQTLAPYFYNGKVFEKPSIRPYLDCLEQVNSASSSNDEDQMKTFIRTIKFCINTMTKKNYNKCIEQLSALDYSTDANVQILVQELILCGMRCPIAVKGLSNDRNDNLKPICELCSDSINHFSKTITKKSNGVDFQEELLKILRKLFIDFVNITKSMDENNENTVDNYKGFMTLFGLMYSNGIIQTNVVMECIDLIKRTIFNSKMTELSEETMSQTAVHHEKMFGHKKRYDIELYNTIVYYDTNVETKEEDGRLLCYRKPIECTNYYKGYEYLMNGIINTFEAKNNDSSQLELFISSHQEFINLNKRFKVQNKTKYANPLTPYIMTLHDDLDKRLRKKAALSGISDAREARESCFA
jgi:hypothetical protein